MDLPTARPDPGPAGAAGSSGPAEPGGPASVWTRPERSGRGPSPAHSRAAIAAAAVALADADGLGAVSMRAVATALGTGPGSLYRYLSSRDDLLDLMADAVVGELALPAPDPGTGSSGWLDAMLAIGREQLALHRRHPWLLDLGARPTGVGPHGLAWFDACLAVLERVDASTTAKLEAVALMTGLVALVAGNERAPRASPFLGRDLGAYPHLVAALTAPSGPPPEQDLFERALRALLVGLLGGR